MRGIIIGAGIGGLSTAIAMQSKNIDVKIYEAAKKLAQLGAGILVPPNAMAVLRKLGLADNVQSAGISIESLTILDLKGKTISETRAIYEKQGIPHQTTAIHRGALQQILLRAVSPDTVITNKKCQQVVSTADGAEATFFDGTSASADFLVGADGIYSRVRESVFPESSLRFSGQTCWRGVSNITLTKPYAKRLSEVWGMGPRFGFVPISDSQVYWYATKVEKPGGKDDKETLKQQLSELFADFPNPVSEIIANTDTTSIIRDDLCDLTPLSSWFSNNIVLMGDAAHASTPNLGQGGAQAIEDSWVLSDSLATERNIGDAFSAFQAARIAKVQKIVNVSWQIGKVTSLSSKAACTVRNAIFRCLPASMAKQQSKMLYDVPY